MATQEITSTTRLHDLSTTTVQDQYTLWQILGIWASAALPMGLVFWVITPMLSPHLSLNAGFVYYILIVLGMVWQGVVAYIILRREVRPFTWEGLKDRLWLHTPSDPGTGRPSAWLLMWTIPLIAFANIAGAKLGWLNELWAQTLPFLAPRPYAVIQNLAGPAVGQWWLMGVLAVDIVFNYVVGEELIFRGILLPKMHGVFGKWDFVANHILFTAYHLHHLWTSPTRLLINWVYPFATKRFKSYWMGAIIHGSDALMLVFLFIMAIRGAIQN